MRRNAKILLACLAAAVALAALGRRLYFTTVIPAYTGDTERNLLYGLLILRDGLAAARLPLEQISPHLERVAWSENPHNYPPLALLFFALVSTLSPTLFFARLVLTAIEALNSWLVWRITRSPWLALIYWISPISIWYASREGQFEPLQSLFMLLSLWALHSRRWRTAMLLLAVAVQVKVLALLLLPYCCWRLARVSRPMLYQGGALFVAALTPTLLTHLAVYPVLSQIFLYSAETYFNPYYWNLLNYPILGGYPLWMTIIHQATSYQIAIELGRRLVREAQRWSLLPAFLFMIFAKVHTGFMFWYWLTWLPLVVAIRDRRLRFWLFVVHPLLDIEALEQVVFGAYHHIVVLQNHYGEVGPFTILSLTP